MKGATGNKVGVLTKGYNIDVAFMYWFIIYILLKWACLQLEFQKRMSNFQDCKAQL
jgi:hypothetical protein